MAEQPTHGRVLGNVARWLLIGALVVVGLWLIYLLRTTILLAGMAFFLAYLLAPIIDRLEAWSVPRSVGILLVTGGLVAAVTGVMLIIVPEVQQQTQYVIEQFPLWVNQVYEWVRPLLERAGISLDQEHIQQYVEDLLRWVQEHMPQLVSPVLRILQNMFSGVANFIVGVFNVAIVPVIAFYILRDYNKIRTRFYEYLPPRWRSSVQYWLGEIDRALGGFLRGQFLIASTLAVYYAIGLTIVGVPLGFLLGIISGLANMVPYMSIVVGLLPAMLLAFLADPGVWRPLWVLIIYVSGQLLEGLVLGPRIMGRETGLHPVIVILSIVVGGTLLGLWGIILAVPAAAVLKVVFQRTMEDLRQRWSRP